MCVCVYVSFRWWGSMSDCWRTEFVLRTDRQVFGISVSDSWTQGTEKWERKRKGEGRKYEVQMKTKIWQLLSTRKCSVWACIYIFYIYRVSQEEWTKLQESVPYVKIYRYNPKHLYPKLNGYGDNGHRKVWASGGSTFCGPSVTPYSYTAHARQRDIVMQWPWRMFTAR